MNTHTDTHRHTQYLVHILNSTSSCCWNRCQTMFSCCFCHLCCTAACMRNTVWMLHFSLFIFLPMSIPFHHRKLPFLPWESITYCIFFFLPFPSPCVRHQIVVVLSPYTLKLLTRRHWLHELPLKTMLSLHFFILRSECKYYTLDMAHLQVKTCIQFEMRFDMHWFAAFVNCWEKKKLDLIDCWVMMQLHSPSPSQIGMSMTFNVF